MPIFPIISMLRGKQFKYGGKYLSEAMVKNGLKAFNWSNKNDLIRNLEAATQRLS